MIIPIVHHESFARHSHPTVPVGVHHLTTLLVIFSQRSVPVWTGFFASFQCAAPNFVFAYSVYRTVLEQNKPFILSTALFAMRTHNVPEDPNLETTKQTNHQTVDGQRYQKSHKYNDNNFETDNSQTVFFAITGVFYKTKPQQLHKLEDLRFITIPAPLIFNNPSSLL